MPKISKIDLWCYSEGLFHQFSFMNEKNIHKETQWLTKVMQSFNKIILKQVSTPDSEFLTYLCRITFSVPF